MSTQSASERLTLDLSKMTIVVEDVDDVTSSSEDNNGTLSNTTVDTNHENSEQVSTVVHNKPIKKQQSQSSGQRYVLEDFKRCSESHLWKLMMSFYDRKGPESWSQGIVPHFITCNTFIGRCYAKVLHGFIRDCYRPQSHMKFDSKEPLYIIELGAGSGKFSFFMLKALAEMQDNCDFPYGKIVYIMTDFTQNNFDFWSNHPSLKPYFDSGHLDAAIFDAVADTEIKCWKSGKILNMTTSTSENPIIIVANYLFDTLYHDIFQVSDGEIKEGLVSVGSKQNEEADPLHPDIINRLDNLYQYNNISPDSYYTHEDGDEIHLAHILNWYKQYYKNNTEGASLLFPIGALRALRRLRNLSTHGRILVISGDKGNNNPEQFLGLTDPHIAVHGSFSLMVNYHAIGAWFTSQGGFSLHNPQEEASLKVSCFVLDGSAATASAANVATASTTAAAHDDDNINNKSCNNDVNGNSSNIGSTSSSTTTANTAVVNSSSNSSNNNNTINQNNLTNQWHQGIDFINELDTQRLEPYPSLHHAFDDCMTLFGPNDFFVLQKSLKEDMTAAPLRTVIALLKLSDWDPDIFFKFRDSILTNAPSCNIKLRNDLCRGLPRVWENHYMLDAEKDVAFEIGRFYYGIKNYQEALYYYNISSETIGVHHVTSHNKGLCYYSLNEWDSALSHFQAAHLLDPNYEKAKNWIDKVKKEKLEKEAASDNSKNHNTHSNSNSSSNSTSNNISNGHMDTLPTTSSSSSSAAAGGGLESDSTVLVTHEDEERLISTSSPALVDEGAVVQMVENIDDDDNNNMV